MMRLLKRRLPRVEPKITILWLVAVEVQRLRIGGVMDGIHPAKERTSVLLCRGMKILGALALAVAFGLAMISAEAVIAPESGHTAHATTAKPHDFKFTYSAFLTGGKGRMYQTYCQMPGKDLIVYKARIKGGKLYVTGTMGCGKSIVRFKNKAFKLTKKTKYYKHVGNGSFYKKMSKKKMKDLLSHKNRDSGGDIHFIVKKGKVTVFAAA